MPVSDDAPEALPPDVSAEDVFSAAVEQLSSRDGAERSVIVVPERSRRAPEVARAVAGHPGLALVPVPGRVTAVATVDHVLRHSELSAAEHVDVALGLASHLRTYAVVSSVARLERPAPSFWAHLASLLPWTRFAVDVHEQVVGKPQDLPRVVPQASLRVLATSTDHAAFTADALPTGPAAHELLLESAPSWGARRAVECTLLLGSVADVVAQILAAAPRDCVNCQVPTRQPRCPFCGVRQTAPEREVDA